MKMSKMTNDFIDKQTVNVPDLHRFYPLAQALAQYRGADILPFTDNNELLTGLVREQAIKRYDKLINESPYRRRACLSSSQTNLCQSYF